LPKRGHPCAEAISAAFALRRAIGALAIAALAVAPSSAAEDAVVIPPPAADVPPTDGLQTRSSQAAASGASRAVFQHTQASRAPRRAMPRQQDDSDLTTVSTGSTGHAESVQIKYDRRRSATARSCRSSFRRARPDPAERQGPDSGTQYRSAILHDSEEQKKVADAISPSSTPRRSIPSDRDKVGALESFFPRQPSSGLPDAAPEPALILLNDLPKVENLKKIFAENYIEKPTLGGAFPTDGGRRSRANLPRKAGPQPSVQPSGRSPIAGSRIMNQGSIHVDTKTSDKVIKSEAEWRKD